MIINYRQRITQNSGLISYDDQGEGTLLNFDTASDITDPIEIALNPDPLEGQFLAVTTRKAINSLTVSSQYFRITDPPTSLPAGGTFWIFYSSECSRWQHHP